MYLIYEHIINNKRYIGKCLVRENQTNEQAMLYRWRGHCKNAKRNSKNDFATAIRDFGKQNIQHSILEIDIETNYEACIAEKFWIKWYNTRSPNGYNMKNGGGGGSRKKRLPFTTLHKQHISESKYKPVHKYTLDGAYLYTLPSVGAAGRDVNKSRRGIRLACQGKIKKLANFQWRYAIEGELIPQTIETCQIIKRIYNPKNKRKIGKYDKQHNLIMIFESIMDASNQTKILYQNILAVLSGRRKYAGKFIWKYIND